MANAFTESPDAACAFKTSRASVLVQRRRVPAAASIGNFGILQPPTAQCHDHERPSGRPRWTGYDGNAFLERFNATLRREALDHFLFLSERHVLRVVTEYVSFYNGARPSQATGTIPDPYDELRQPPSDAGRVVALPVLGGIQHDYRRAA